MSPCALCDATGIAWQFPSANVAWPLLLDELADALRQYEVPCNCCKGTKECDGACAWVEEWR